jgi:hypothetical protein
MTILLPSTTPAAAFVQGTEWDWVRFTVRRKDDSGHYAGG